MQFHGIIKKFFATKKEVLHIGNNKQTLSHREMLDSLELIPEWEKK